MENSGTFIDLMGNATPSRWKMWDSRDREWLNIVSSHYDEMFQNRNHHEMIDTVPHIIHHIWLGEQIPEIYDKFRKDWQAYHTDWELMFWTNADIENFGIFNIAAFNSALNLGEKSDIWRYEILYRYGGIYVDADFVCVKSLQEIADYFDFFAGLSNVGAVEINNALIGCTPNHRIMSNLIESIQSNYEKNNIAQSSSNLLNEIFGGNSTSKIDNTLASFMGTDDLAKLNSLCSKSFETATVSNTGPGLLTRTLIDMTMKVGNIPSSWMIFPTMYFYPFSNSYSNLKENIETVAMKVVDEYRNRSVVHAIHLWAKSWQSK